MSRQLPADLLTKPSLSTLAFVQEIARLFGFFCLGVLGLTGLGFGVAAQSPNMPSLPAIHTFGYVATAMGCALIGLAMYGLKD